MKKLFVAASVAAFVATLSAPAHANYSPQGIFGGRHTPDGAIDMRDRTTEQFDPVRGQSVADRARPDFDPTPMDVGSFQFFPSMAVGTYYDSNIYAGDTVEDSDVIVKLNPEAALVSNWGRHALNFSAIGDANYHIDNGSENNYNGALMLDGRYDILRGMWVGGKLGYQRATEPRSNPNTPGVAEEPVQFDQTTAGATFWRGMGLLSTMANYNMKMYDYIDPNATGGGKVDLSGRDRTEHVVTGTVGYEVSPNFKPFVRAKYDVRNYDSNAARDSDGYGVVVGSRNDFGGIVTGEIYAGYLQHEYDGFSGDGDIATMDFGGDILWNITELTSLEAEVSRNVEETTIAAGYLSTGGSLTATHELRRNVILDLHTDWTNNDYTDSGREDDIYGVGTGARYYLSRNFYSDLTYDFSTRESNAAGSDYDKHIVFLHFGAQY